MKFFEALRKHKKAVDLTIKICAVVFTFLFGILTVASSIMIENSSAINRAFNIQTTRQEEIETGDDEEIDDQ